MRSLQLRPAPFVLILTLTLALSGLGFAQDLGQPPAVPTPTVLAGFTASTTSIASPFGFTAQGQDGNIYGTGSGGGANNTGGVFKATPSGTISLVASFPAGYSGCAEGVTLGNDGNFYGVCFTGNPATGLGSFWKVTSAGVFTDLYDFKNQSTGEAQPQFAPILGNDGAFYGMTPSSGSSNGAIYKVTTAGVFTILHTFGAGDQNPVERLVQATDGNLYGALGAASTSGGFGGIFKIATSGSGYKILFGFTGGNNGYGPNSGLVQGSDGKLYGSTSSGGTSANGVMYRIATAGTGYTVLRSITSSTDGAPNFLIQATDGNRYGTAYGGGNGNSGGLWEMTSAGAFSSFLFPSAGSTYGTNPFLSLMQHTNGTLFSTTTSGGSVGSAGEFLSQNIGAAGFASLVTQTGKVGAKIGILGQGFSTSSVVKFNGVQVVTKTVTGTTYIQATVPVGANTGAVTVTTGATTLTTPQSFRVTPAITSFTPSSGPVGTLVTINGSGLTQVSKVTFNNVAATTFTVITDSQITATVPTGATTGKVAVTTPGGTANSATNFTVM